MQPRWKALASLAVAQGNFALSAALASQTASTPRVPCWKGMHAHSAGELEELPTGAVLIVDPMCSYLGGYVSRRAQERGFASVQVLSDHLLSHLDAGNDLEPFGAPPPGGEAAWAAALPFPVVGVLCESDAGLETAERLRSQLLCGGGGRGVSAARRDKFLMGEAVRRAGLAAVRQVKTGRWEEAELFLRSLVPADADDAAAGNGNGNDETGKSKPNAVAAAAAKNVGADADAAVADVRAVVKPPRGCASGDVFLCEGLADARRRFTDLIGTAKYGSPGEINDQALIQEYLRGTEYVVDTMSRAGKHKVMAVWRYDKRPINGAPFVYHCTELRSTGGAPEAAVAAYVLRVLDALAVTDGPAHIEVMLTAARGPVLVEFNGRWHVQDFRPICDACIGYNALDAALDACIDPTAFDSLPDAPPRQMRAAGRIVHLVCHAAGRLKRVRHLEELEAMESLQGYDVYGRFRAVGAEVEKTVDLRSDAGWARLVHTDEAVVDRDYFRLVELQKTMFEVEEEEEGGEGEGE